MVQQDGKIVAVGASAGDFAVFRLLPDGSLDPSFGDDGEVRTDFGGNEDAPHAVGIQADGKIVVVGSSDNKFALARYGADGSLDTSFDGDGKVVTAFAENGTALQASALGVVFEQSGDIVAGGFSGFYDAERAQTFLPAFTLARYHANGSLNTSFGQAGKARLETDNSGAGEYVTNVQRQPDGKFVLASELALGRFNNNGSPDANFGQGGVLPFSANNGFIVVQQDGKLVVVGDDHGISRLWP